MDSNPFQTVRKYLDATPAAKWGAVAASVLASVCLVLLFPVLYLFADLMATHGRVPAYSQLPASQQRKFRDEWDDRLSKNPDITQTLNIIRPAPWATVAGPAAEWEWRWQATTHDHLRTRVGDEAAEYYLPLATVDPAKGAAVSAKELGVLGLVARERGHWTGSLGATVARWNPWMWRPNDDGTANPGYLFGLFVVGFLLMLGRALFQHGATHLATTASIDATSRLRRTMFNHSSRLAAMATRYESQKEAGAIVTQGAEQIQDGLISLLTGAVRGPVVAALLVAFLFATHPWLTLGILLLAAFVWLAAGQLALWFRHDGRLATRRAEARLRSMRESFFLSRLVKSYLMERFSQNRFERQLADVSKASWRRHRGEALSRPAIMSLASLVAVVVLYVAGRVVVGGEMSAAGLVVKAAAVATLLFTLNRWVSARIRVGRAREAAAEVVEFLDRRGDAGQAIDAEFLPPLAKKLEFVDVSLREAGTGRMVLENVSFALAAGSRTAVVFSDAAEAESFANLITRFADPTAGEIRFDGKNIRWVTFESIRTHTALILEDATTFTDTVANNIGCGDGSFSLPQIIEAAKIAHAHQFVQRLPYGYETLIGDGGVSLRPGERFRIALARAILRDPSLLIIEEPAEPIDADSWVLIDDTIARVRQNRTLLFLARRPGTARSADRILVLHQGRLVANGHHDDLVAHSDLYRLLHFKQNLTTTAT